MKALPGCLLMLLASCATQNHQGHPGDAGADLEAEAAGFEVGEASPPTGSHGPRLGIEYLPSEQVRPEVAAAPLAPSSPMLLLSLGSAAAPLPEVVPAPRSAPAEFIDPDPDEDPRQRLPWDMDRDEIARIDNPVERFTLQFVRNIVGEDRNRVQRRISAPILFNRSRRASSYGALWSVLDERDHEDQELLVAREGRSLLSKPFRSATRDSTFIRDLELVLEDFKETHLPLRGGEETRGGRNLGRLSLRLRRLGGSDPVEVTYVREGWRIGSGQRRLRVGYRTDLSDSVGIALRTNYRYHSASMDVSGDLHWQLSDITRFHLLAGNQVDLLTGTTMYPLVHSPVVLRAADESLGALFYVEHLF
ncbi:MAG: hypothetical protein AAF628_07450 [Planctomycetota bacterium]